MKKETVQGHSYVYVAYNDKPQIEGRNADLQHIQNAYILKERPSLIQLVHLLIRKYLLICGIRHLVLYPGAQI